ncbi:hypothetical protein [Pseudomonas entomophila]|uniref:hypothetical protein n=1 Tax=Pseudomonas entomophila TaxID=312306 RepID=UPI00200CE0AB|nr:hypothetical protein [Pseudomonas entomophila]
MKLNLPTAAPFTALPDSDQETFSALVVLSMTLQAQLALAPMLPPREAAIDDLGQWPDEQWQAATAQWWQGQSATLQAQLRELLTLQVRAKAQRLGAPRADIEALLPDAAEEPTLAAVTLVIDDEVSVRVPGFLALSHDLYDDEEPLVLCGLGAGVWFDTYPRLGEALLAHLQGDDCWLQAMAEEERAALKAASGVTLKLSWVEGAPEEYLLEDMQALQRQLVINALNADDGSADAAVALEPWLAGLQACVAEIIATLRQDLTPEWLRHLSEAEAQRLSDLNQAVIDAEEQLEQQSGHGDFYAYAEHRIGLWLADQGFPQLKPADVLLHITHDFTPDAQVNVVSLLEWVCGGRYRGRHLAVAIQHDELRDAVGQEGVSRLADELQLHQGYVERVENIYQHDWTLYLLGKALDARLQLARQAADFQGLDRKAVKLLEEAVQGPWSQGSGPGQFKVALLSINGEMLLTDHLYLYNDDIHVLYAPGSPAGDLQAFTSAGQMSFALGALTATPQGREYLVEHVQHAQRPVLKRYLQLIARLPQEWSHETIQVDQQDIDSWEQLIQFWSELRVLKIVDDLEPVRPETFARPDDELQRRVEDLGHELRVLTAQYQEAAQVPDFMAYARERVSERINRYPGNKGGWIDADTVLVELEDGVRQSLTLVVASGYPADFNFRDYARFTSTVGQDLSHLKSQEIDGYIRAAELGKGYCGEVRKRYLDPEGDDQSGLLELHRHILGMKIQRDCLLELQRGRVSDEHARWLTPVCMDFHRGSFVEDCKLAELQINGAVIAGAYLLQSAEARGTLIYLGDGLEGRHLYNVGEFVDQWRGDAMQDWVFDRIAVDDEAKIHTLNESVRNADSDREGNDRIVASLQVLHNIKDLAVALRQRIERLLAEAERDAYSAARRITREVLWMVELVAEAVALVFPPVRIVLGFVKAGITFYRSLVALRDGDRTAALFALLKGLISLPGATSVLKFYGTRLFDHGSRLWSQLFPGPSSSLSVWLKRQVEWLKALYAEHELIIEVGVAGTKRLYGTFEDEVAWLTELAVYRQEPGASHELR